MECACVEVEENDVGCCDIHEAKKVRARKQLKCHECPRHIMPGETYERVKMLFEGHWSEHRTCPDCLSIRDAFYCGGYIYESIREYAREHIRDVCGELSETKISELTPAAMEWICEEIEDSWGGRYCGGE